MITYVKGKLIEKNPTHVVIECNGIGYYILISLQSFSKLPDQENTKLFTHLSIREDAHTLYGFYDKLEREIFKMLISVSGVGPSTAITMLSSMTSEQVQHAIAHDDVVAIKSVKGIGPKTAQRVILDLKDKILKTYNVSDDPSTGNDTIKNEALSALEILGFPLKNAEKVISKILQASTSINLEELIKQALKQL